MVSEKVVSGVEKMRILASCMVLALFSAIVAAENGPAYGLDQDDDGSQRKPGCGCGSTSRGTAMVGDATEIGEAGDATPAAQIRSIETPEPVTEAVKENMAFIPGGRTFMGTNAPILKPDGEGPMRPITLSPYFIDRFAVTNEGTCGSPKVPVRRQ